MSGGIGMNEQCVQTHMTIVQAAIARMASNSSSCKTWCVTLCSAILVVAADKEHVVPAWVPACPVIVFALLDAYYLGLEKALRSSYNDFVSKAHEGRLTVPDLFAFVPRGVWRSGWSALRSFSVWGCYLPLLGVVLATGLLTK